MLYVRKARGSIDEVARKLEAAAADNKFGVLGVHDLKQKMNAKGVEFGPECRIFEVCNPVKAKAVLEADMTISNALPGPVRISVSGEQGTLFAGLFGHAALVQDGEVVQRLLPVADRHGPSLRRLVNRHVHDL
jgi:uncharacterized protein (DUF302 family)